MRSQRFILLAVVFLLPLGAEARWVADASKGSIPASPAAGQVLGRPFRVSRAEVKVAESLLVPLPSSAKGPARTSRRVMHTLTLAQKGAAAGTAPHGYTVFLSLPEDQKLDGKSFLVGPKGIFAMAGKVKEGRASYPPVQSVLLSSNPSGKKAQLESPRKYTLRLEFGKTQGKKIPGRIYLAAQDKARSWVRGTFTAILTK